MKTRSVGGLERILGTGPGAVQMQVVQAFNETFAAPHGQAVMQAGSGVCGLYSHRTLPEDSTGIESFVHLHDGNPRLIITIEDRLLNGRGSAPAG